MGFASHPLSITSRSRCLTLPWLFCKWIAPANLMGFMKDTEENFFTSCTPAINFFQVSKLSDNLIQEWTLPCYLLTAWASKTPRPIAAQGTPKFVLDLVF